MEDAEVKKNIRNSVSAEYREHLQRNPWSKQAL